MRRAVGVQLRASRGLVRRSPKGEGGSAGARATVAVSFLAALMLCAPLAWSAGAPAEEAAQPRERIERLENGLRVIVRERHLGGVAAFRVYLRAGSLHEGEFTGSGVSHLLEHVVSGGSTTNMSEDKIREALDTIGAQTNAHTSKQYVCYHGQADAEQVEKLIELIAEYVMHCRVGLIEFGREHKVVQRELERAEANPDHVLWRLADATFFHDHPARHPIIGHLDILKDLKRDDAWTYYQRVATPQNAVAVVVGDFDADAVFEAVERIMGPWQQRRGPVTVLPERTPQTAPRHAERAMDVAGVRRILEFPTVRLTHPDLYPLDVLAFVLGEGRASRLVGDLREKRGLVQAVSCWSYTPAGYDGGRLMVRLVSVPEKAAEAREAALEHLWRVAREGITEEELARAKRQKIAEHVYHLQTCENIAADLGTSELLVGDAHFSDRYVAGIQQVTAEEVKRVAAKYLRPEVLCEAVVRPRSRPVAAPPDEEAKPDEGKADEKLKVAKKTLPGGTRLLLCPIEGHPTVSIQMCLKGGLSVERESNAGISQFLARMLLKGTAEQSAAEIAETLSSLGAEMNASSGRNTVYLSARCLPEDFETTFDLAAESLLRPALPEEEAEKVRRQLLAEIDQLQDTPHGEAAMFFRRHFFRDSPYRFPVQGTRESVSDLTLESLREWHRKIVFGGNLVVAVFGGIDAEAAEALVAEAVEGLPETSDLMVPQKAEPRQVPIREVYIKPTKKPAAVVYVAYPGFDLTNVRDRAPMAVLDTIVSGYRMPGGWLHEALRGKGLVYEVHAYSLAGLRPGYFAAYAVCQPEKVHQVVNTIEWHLGRATRETFKEEQLEPARSTVITAKKLGRETVEEWAFEACLNECLGLGYAYARAEVERIREVKPEDVSRVAEWYIRQPVICVLTSDPKAAEAVRK